MPVIAFINGGSAVASAHNAAAFPNGLNETGYIEGQSPHSSQGGFVVKDLAGAKQAIDWYVDHGYPQIKIYNSFPKEILRPPRSLAEKMYSDIRRWTKMPKGGHFAALEQPELLANEIREFFRPLR